MLWLVTGRIVALQPASEPLAPRVATLFAIWARNVAIIGCAYLPRFGWLAVVTFNCFVSPTATSALGSALLGSAVVANHTPRLTALLVTIIPFVSVAVAVTRRSADTSPAVRVAVQELVAGTETTHSHC